jgi:hypothetical protein
VLQGFEKPSNICKNYLYPKLSWRPNYFSRIQGAAPINKINPSIQCPNEYLSLETIIESDNTFKGTVEEVTHHLLVIS